MKVIEKYKNLNLIAKASLWFVLTIAIDKAAAFLTQPFINRILTVEENGVFGVYSSWLSIFYILGSFYLFNGVLEVFLTKEPEKSNKIVSSLCNLSLICCVFVSALILIFNNFFTAITGLKGVYLLLMCCTIFSDTIIQFWAVQKRFSYSYVKYSVVTVAVFLCKCFLSVLFSYLFESDRVLGRVLGLLIPNAIACLIILVFFERHFEIDSIKEYWKKAILFNLPLIPHYLASVLLSGSDRIVIEKLANTPQLGQYNVGIYSVAYAFSSIVLVLFQAINSAYNPYCLKCIKNKEYAPLSKTTNIVLVISIVFAILVMLFAPEGLYIIGGEKYNECLDMIPILIVGIFLSVFYFIFSNIEFCEEKTKYIFPITLIGTGLNILLNYLLIPFFGYKIAALTTLIGYLIIFVLHYVVCAYIIKIRIFNMKFIFGLISMLIASAFLCNLLYISPSFIRYIVAFLFLIVLTFLFSKYGKSYLESKRSKKGNMEFKDEDLSNK